MPVLRTMTLNVGILLNVLEFSTHLFCYIGIDCASTLNVKCTNNEFGYTVRALHDVDVLVVCIKNTALLNQSMFRDEF